ncbi:MAG: peptide ABC transporter substrate-binding protein [Firmicutes bacterium]|nr:peptide ABC transporter substrate-binding protein [Bacillota bacterium]
MVLKKMAVVMASAGLLAAGLAACGSSPTTTSTQSSAPFVEALSQNPDNLTPAMGTLAVDNMPLELMNASLAYLNLHDKWTGEIATSWSESSNGLTYTFNLNPKATWSDGKPLTSADVVYTWHYMTNPKIQITYNTGWNYVKNVVAEGPHKVVFTLTQPYAPFMATVGSSYIVPKHIFDKWTPSQINHGIYTKSTPVVAGPYVLKSWQQDQSLTFVPNPHWFGSPVHIQKMILQIVPNTDTQFNMLSTGKLSLGTIPSSDVTQASSLSSKYTIEKTLQATYNLIQLDENHFLKDVKVRQALDYATPKQQIVTDIMHGLAIVAHGDQVPGGYFYDPNVPHRTFSLTKAAAILKADGFTKGAGGWLYKNGQELTVPIWTGSTSHSEMDIAQVVSQDWEKIGVYAPVHTAGWSIVFGNGTPQNPGPQVNGKDEALIFSWGQGVFPDDTIDFNSKYVPKSPFQPSPQENGERYVNAQMDQLQAQGVTLSSRPARRKVYDQIQKLEQKTLPVIFLFWYKNETAVSKNLHGYQQTVFGTTPVWDWSMQ